MSLEKLKIIDFIGIEKATNDVTLTISDDLDWQNVLDHVYLLQEKINYYLSFIESGEIEKNILNLETEIKISRFILSTMQEVR